MFVVRKQNDGNSKLIISVFFYLPFFLPMLLYAARPTTPLSSDNDTHISNIKKKTLTGAIYVVDELDFETKQNYDLIIRATDSVSGVYAEVPLSIAVTGNETKSSTETF
jgi:hypothetical protein